MQWPDFSGMEYYGAVDRVLESGVYTQGREVETFEHEFGRWLDPFAPPYVVMTSSGTTALTAILRALEIGPGKNVYLPASTFTATLLAVLLTGANPVLIDINEQGAIDVDALRRTKPRLNDSAVLSVDLDGIPVDYHALLEFVSDRDLWFVSDSCPAVGATWCGINVSLIADATAVSFNQTKILPAGEGGAIITRSETLAELLRGIINFGEIPTVSKLANRYSSVVGGNYKPTEIMAAVARVSLTKVNARLERARHNASVLGKFPFAYSLPTFDSRANPSWHKFRLGVPEAARAEVDFVNAGIPVGLMENRVLPLYRQVIMHEKERLPAMSASKILDQYPYSEKHWRNTIPLGSRAKPFWMWTDEEVVEIGEKLCGL